MSERPKKPFKLFRKRTPKPEGLNLKVPPMMINRLNRLVATGAFGLNVEEAAERMLAHGVLEHERIYGPFVDLIDTRGHPNPKQLYQNVDEAEEKCSNYADKRKLLTLHDELEEKRQRWVDDDNITQDHYDELVDEILKVREQAGLPEPDWLKDYEDDSEEEEADEEDQP